MTPTPVSVCLIAKNCAKQLSDCLDSLKDFVRPGVGDEIVVVDTGSNDDGATVAAAKERGATVYEHPELNASHMRELVKQWVPEAVAEMDKERQFDNGFLADFAAARQLSFEHAKNETVFWVDSDDILVGGAALRDAVDEFFAEPQNTCLFLAYDYAFDEDGTCTTVLWRERILRRSRFKWVGVCHEALIPVDGRQREMRKIPSETSRLLHKHGRHHVLSDLRNYAILREAYERADWKDPRWEFYLGNACRGLQRYQESIDWYSKTLVHSGSPEDRLSAILNIGYAYLLFGRPWRAIDFFFQAIKILPADPRAYFGVARAYHLLRQHEECLRWTAIGRSFPKPPLLTSVDPNHYDFYPTVFEALSLKELGQVPAAREAARAALSMRPGLASAQQLVEQIEQWAQQEALKTAVGAVCKHAFSSEAATQIIHSVRPEIRKAITDLQLETVAPPPRKSVTFICGVAPEPWDATSADGGIGGSEKMVVLLARELARKGWRVDVYGNPRSGNEYRPLDGVTYRPIQSFNPAFPRDVVIIWRHWGALEAPIKARRLLMDLHDVQHPQEYTAPRLARLHRAVFKSQFHLDPVKAVVGDKAVVLRNAVDPAHFTSAAGPRDYKRIVYCSSGDRGLKRVLRIFGRLKALDPGFSLHWYYGFTPFYLKKASEFPYLYMGDEGCERHMLDYAEECFSLSDKLGAAPHGRIGWADLATELKASGIWLYPTKFPEISCMAALEAQAAGVVPVCSAFGALTESVKLGVFCDPDDDAAFIRGAMEIAQQGAGLDQQRADNAAKVIAEYDISALADDWIKLFA